MMGLFLLVIFTQATRAGNNSKAETFPLGRWEGVAACTLMAVARAPASRDGAVSGQDGGTMQLTFGLLCCMDRSQHGRQSPLAAPARKAGE